MNKFLLILYGITYSYSILANPIVSVYSEESYRVGSGFVAYTDKEISGIITNHHVCNKNYPKSYKPPYKSKVKQYIYHKNLTIKIDDNTYEGYIVAVDVSNDLCMIHINKTIEPIPRLKRYKMLYNEVCYILSPSPFRISKCRFLGPDNELDKYSDTLKDSQVIEGNSNYGQSGSAIVNDKGYLIGVLWAKGTGKENYNKIYIVGIDAVNNFIEKSIPYLYENSIEVKEFR